MKASKKGVLSMLFLLTGVISICFGSVRARAAQDETICNGVYIDKINVSGMTKKEAKNAVDSYIEALKQKEIGIVLDEDISVVTVGDLGYSCDENTYVDDALNLGRVGNLIKRYKELMDVENVGMNYSLQFTLDDQKVRDFIQNECSKFDIPATNALVSRSNGQFVYTQEVTGRKVDQEATYDAIRNTILTGWSQQDVVIDAVIDNDKPQYTLEDVKQCNALLGTYNTNYATSTAERKANVANAAKLINGTVVYPGEVFSCYEKMQPFTTANGYYSAHAYVNGMVEDSIGGGVCQVSTTLYNAVIRSELEVVERAAHSMTVSYVPVAFDAAIAGTYKDLKFKNNLNVPLLVEAIANGTTITFNIYGAEVRDTVNRRIEFKSEVISRTEPPKDVIKQDPTQPTSYRKVTQSAYTGYVAVLYKYIYENGVLVDTIQLNRSTYQASPAYVTVGTKEEVVDEEQEATDDKEEETKPSKPTKPEQGNDDTENGGKPSTDKNENKPDQTEEETDDQNSASGASMQDDASSVADIIQSPTQDLN